MGVEFLRSKVFLFFAGFFLILLAVFLAKELQKRYEIHQEITALEQEISTLESKNKEIFELLNYLKTTEFKERQARSLLNLQKPGEFAVVLPPLEEEQSEVSVPQTREQIGKNNLQQWWNYYFQN